MQSQTIKLIDHFLSKGQLDSDAISLLDFCTAATFTDKKDGEEFTSTLLYQLLSNPEKYNDFLIKSKEVVKKQIQEHTYNFVDFFRDEKFADKLKFLESDLGCNLKISTASVFSKHYKPQYDYLIKDEFLENFFMEHLLLYMNHLVKYKDLPLNTFFHPENKINFKSLFAFGDTYENHVRKYQLAFLKVLDKHSKEKKDVKTFWKYLEKEEVWKYLSTNNTSNFLLDKILQKKSLKFVKQSFFNYWLNKDESRIHHCFLLLNLDGNDILKMKKLPELRNQAEYIFGKSYPAELVGRYFKEVNLMECLKIPFVIKETLAKEQFIVIMQEHLVDFDLSFYKRYTNLKGLNINTILEKEFLIQTNKNTQTKAKIQL